MSDTITQDTIIGIDLGTSTTEAAVIKNGRPVMILNFDHSEITPSFIGINPEGILFSEMRQRHSISCRRKTLCGRSNEK